MSTPAILNVNSSAVAFGDVVASNNPKRKYFDWQRNANGLVVHNPEGRQYTVAPRESAVLLDTSRAVVLGADTAFNVSYLGESDYRITWASGQDPVFRAAVETTFLADTTFTVAILPNRTVTVEVDKGTPFAAVVAGNIVYVNGADDALRALNPENAGFWKVLSATATKLTLVRRTGEDFHAAEETVVAADGSTALYVFAAAGVQPGDKVLFSAGFQADSLRVYDVKEVTSEWIEVVSSLPIAEEQGVVPGVGGMAFFSAAKRFLRLEVTQETVVKLNDSTDANQVVSPWMPGDPEQAGWLERCGPVWKIEVVNKSSEALAVSLFTAE